MISKHNIFILCTFIFLLACAGNGFAGDASLSRGFLNNNSSPALPSSPMPEGMAAKKTFRPMDFSFPEARLDRWDSRSMEKLLTEGEDAPIAKPTSAKKKVGKIMAIAGLGATGAGTIMLIANGGNDPREIGDSGMGINWKATGIAWIGVGMAVAIAGFILMGSK